MASYINIISASYRRVTLFNSSYILFACENIFTSLKLGMYRISSYYPAIKYPVNCKYLTG